MGNAHHGLVRRSSSVPWERQQAAAYSASGASPALWGHDASTWRRQSPASSQRQAGEPLKQAAKGSLAGKDLRRAYMRREIATGWLSSNRLSSAAKTVSSTEPPDRAADEQTASLLAEASIKQVPEESAVSLEHSSAITSERQSDACAEGSLQIGEPCDDGCSQAGDHFEERVDTSANSDPGPAPGEPTLQDMLSMRRSLLKPQVPGTESPASSTSTTPQSKSWRTRKHARVVSEEERKRKTNQKFVDAVDVEFVPYIMATNEQEEVEMAAHFAAAEAAAADAGPTEAIPAEFLTPDVEGFRGSFPSAEKMRQEWKKVNQVSTPRPQVFYSYPTDQLHTMQPEMKLWSLLWDEAVESSLQVCCSTGMDFAACCRTWPGETRTRSATQRDA